MARLESAVVELALAMVLATLSRTSQQDSLSRTDAPVQLEDVEVVGRRGRALVDPVAEWDGPSIDALGAYDIGEVIQRLSEDQGLGSSPMIVVNGRRVADPGVFSGFPPDALVRVEVLPSQASGLYGATDPPQRVLNIVLQPRFDSRDGRVELRRPSAGGRSEIAGDLRQSSIRGANTHQVGLHADAATALRASERDLDQVLPWGGGVSLRPASRNLSANYAQTAALGPWSSSLRVNLRREESRSAVRRDREVLDARRRSDGVTFTGGLTGEAAGWLTSLTLIGAVAEGDQTGLLSMATRQASGTINLSLNRKLLDLPAGPVSGGLSGQASRTRSTTELPASRQVFSGYGAGVSGNLAVPLWRRAPGAAAWAGLGDVSMSLGASVNQSDAGRGEGVSAGLNWAPHQRVRIDATWSTALAAVPDEQRFGPRYYGDPVIVFDFRNGEAVEVLPLLGGNPELRSPRTSQFGFSLSVGPFTSWAVQGGVNLQRTVVADGNEIFPDPTPDLEAAFPDRFVRGDDGRLLGIDRRAFNIDSSENENLASHLSIGAPLPFGKRDGRRPHVLRLALNYNLPLRNMTLLDDRLPHLDRLAGDAGGQPRSTFGVSADLRVGGWGFNAASRWRGGYRVRRDIGEDSPDDLLVSRLEVADVRISYRLSRAFPGGAPTEGRRAIGMEIELEVANLFDARPSARLADGRPAMGYGPDDQDPVGRTIRLGVRRRF